VSLDLPRALSALFLSFQYAVGVSHSIHPFPSLRQASRLIPPISSSAHAVAITDVDLKIPLKAVDDAVISTVTDGMMATNETGTYILKPYRSPKSKKLRTAVVFVPRLSHFDIENERSNNNEFRVRLHSLRLSVPPRLEHALTCVTTQIGVLHTLLDLDLHMDGPHVRAKHRNTRRSAQLAVCYHALKRRAYTGAQ